MLVEIRAKEAAFSALYSLILVLLTVNAGRTTGCSAEASEEEVEADGVSAT